MTPTGCDGRMYAGMSISRPPMLMWMTSSFLMPSVSASRERWSLLFRRRLANVWTADAGLTHRTSRYSQASTPRKERLVELSLAATRDLRSGWSVAADYRWSDNDSNVAQFAYEAQRIALSLSRSFERL